MQARVRGLARFVRAYHPLIKRFIRRVLRLASRTKPSIVPKSEHGVGREQLSLGSRRACETLQHAGYQAYVVGGAVRELLLGVLPKDFDVATDAPPEEVRRLFRRSRLIGRRFKIAQVMFGDETVEVSTFRSGEAEDKDEHGRVLRDNAYGTREQDAARGALCGKAGFSHRELDRRAHQEHGRADRERAPGKGIR